MDNFYLPNEYYDNLENYDHIFLNEDYLIVCTDNNCFNLYPSINYLSSDNYTIEDYSNYIEIDKSKFTNNYLYYPSLWQLCICLMFFFVLFVYLPYRVLNRLLGGKIYV